MKKVFGLLLAFVFLFCVWGTSVLAADQSSEIEQLKQEVNKLLNRIEELEKKQTESEKKAVEVEKKTVDVEKKVADVEKKAEIGEKKALKDRVHLSGEARFRIMSAYYDTPAGFYGDRQPSADSEFGDETSFPLRFRLNMWAEVAPNIIDFYARLTMNKRWGAYDSVNSPSSDPFNKPNSYEASIGHDITFRVEQAYATFKIPSINSTWYVGRLPGLDGAPSRQDRSLFPRLFIDSEIDGTLIKWDAPHTSLDDTELPWTKTRLWGGSTEVKAGAEEPTIKREFSSRKAYEAKAKEKTGIILGYLKYDEKKESAPDDADVFLAQGLLKIGKGTSLVVDGLFMDDWHMPNSGGVPATTVPDLVTQYYLTGVYADTQLGGCQVYGAYYYSHFEIPTHSGSFGTFNEDDFPGHIWYLGFNTGDLLGAKHQFTAEYANGSDAWINPFNYRGYRRKGTVSTAANNYFYDSTKVVGFYPFNAGVLDAYYDYFFRSNVRFRLGLIDFNYDKHDEHLNSRGFSILGSSKYEHAWWPYFEVNLSF